MIPDHNLVMNEPSDESSSSEGEDVPDALLCGTIDDEVDPPLVTTLKRGLTMHESITILTKVKRFMNKMIQLRANNRKKYKIVEEIVSF